MEVLIDTPTSGRRVSERKLCEPGIDVGDACGYHFLHGVVVVGLVMPGLRVKTLDRSFDRDNGDVTRCYPPDVFMEPKSLLARLVVFAGHFWTLT